MAGFRRCVVCLTFPHRIQFYRFRVAFILWCTIIAVLYFSLNDTFKSTFRFKKTLRFKYVKHVGNYSSACRLPNLDAFHSSILEFVKDLGKLKCEGVRYSSFANNVLEVRGEQITSVMYKTVERPPEDDFNVVLSDPVSMINMADAGKKDRNTGKLTTCLLTLKNAYSVFKIETHIKLVLTVFIPFNFTI